MSWFYSPPSLQDETTVWQSAVSGAGGTLEADSLDIANGLMSALNATAYRPKILYLLPFLGADLTAARVPLIDDLGVGIAANTGFVGGDFSQATGLQGATNKRLDTGFTMSQLNATDQRGGIGVWECNSSRAGDGYVMGASGASSDNAFWLDLGPGSEVQYWGSIASNRYTISSAANIEGFQYAQRSATNNLSIYHNTSLPATNSNTYTPAGLGDRNVYVGAANFVAVIVYGLRLLGLAIATDGTLSNADVASLYGILNDELIVPTGR